MLATRVGADHVDIIGMLAQLARLARLPKTFIHGNGVQNSTFVYLARYNGVGLLKSLERQNGIWRTAKATFESNETRVYLQKRADVIRTETFDSSLLEKACVFNIVHLIKRPPVRSSVIIFA